MTQTLDWTKLSSKAAQLLNHGSNQCFQSVFVRNYFWNLSALQSLGDDCQKCYLKPWSSSNFGCLGVVKHFKSIKSSQRHFSPGLGADPETQKIFLYSKWVQWEEDHYNQI